MAFIGLDVPADAALLLEGLSGVPGDRESASDMHVTIVHLGKAVAPVQVAKAMLVAHSVAASFGPLNLSLDRVTNFPSGNDGFPIICPIESPELQALNAALKSELSRFGIPFSDKWPEFRPHVTLGYLRDADPGFSIDSPLSSPLPFSVSQLCLWGGDAVGPESVRIQVPLAMKMVDRVASRIVARRVFR